jgi:chromosome segregation protein
VALGAHLQDVVVERWEHAEAAVDLLKRTRAGRATFLPLDTIRGGSPTGAPVTGPGVRGAATHLVEFDERYRAVAEQLLGRTLIVDDLPVARRVLRDVGGGWQIVTLAGEVVRSNGAITGGSNQGAGDRTLLARERERRELPQRLAAIATSGQSLEDELAAQRARQMEIEAAQRTLQTEQRAGAEAVTRAREAVAAATGRIERLGREVEWSRESVGRFETELAALDAREVALRERLATVPADGDEHERTIAALQSRLTELDHLTREQSQRVIAFRNNVAVIEGERRAQTRLLEGHAERRARVVDEMEARRRRIDELTGSAATFVEEAEELEAARGALDDQRQSLTGESEPLQGELSTLAEQLRLIQSGEAAGRAQLNEMADQVRAVAIQAQSARDHLHSLLREAATELAELAPTESPLPLGEGQGEGVPGDGGSATDLDPREDQGVDRPPTHSQASLDDAAPELVYEPLTAPEATWRRIELLRSRLRMIGAVDASAGQEYDETLARHAFLSGQAADLIDASRVLKEAIAELETTMQARFEETFAAVAVAFKQHFTALFGGGTARLVLAENESGGVPGVEIIAQPPGKRAQSLSLLSGGERALTAVAILFAILEVNPTPVCMLDEVDAALDDANVMRFGQTLRRLAERTQFVVITHNRGTMEAADALYGVSMLDRSTSRTVSLKLVDIPA